MRIGSLVMHVQDLERAVGFWTGALHYRVRDGEITAEGSPVLLGDEAGALAITLDDGDGIHLDLHTDSAAEQMAEVERLVALGARRVNWNYPEGATHVVLADPEGNLFCVVDTGRGNADFRTSDSTQASGELVAQSAVAPPGDCGVGGEVGLAQDG